MVNYIPKSEIIVLAAFVLLVCVSPVIAAADHDMIGHRDFMDYITEEVEWFFQAFLWIGVLLSLITMQSHNPVTKALAQKALIMCAVILALYYMFPAYSDHLARMASSGRNTTST